MQWLLQEFEDTRKLAEALDRLGIPYTWHKVVPFVGELVPEPIVADPNSVVMFGSYALWRTAEANGYWPGVFKLRPFVQENTILSRDGNLADLLADLFPAGHAPLTSPSSPSSSPPPPAP
jgi:hypothetical protein